MIFSIKSIISFSLGLLFLTEAWSKILVCYYHNWTLYRIDGCSGEEGCCKNPECSFMPFHDNLDTVTKYCTHIVYAFANVNGETCEILPSNHHSDLQKDGVDGYAKITALKSEDVQVIIGIGGPILQHSPEAFSKAISTPEKRDWFVSNISYFVQKYHFDGVLLHWEYPNPYEDPKHLAIVLEKLRDKVDEGKMKSIGLIGAASEAVAMTAYDFNAINEFADYMIVLAYFHKNYTSGAYHPSPIVTCENQTWEGAWVSTVEYIMDVYSVNVVKEKLIVGVNPSGVSYTLRDPNQNSYGDDTSGPGNQIYECTCTAGIISYDEICNDYSWIKTSLDHCGISYYVKGNQWAAVENVESATLKAQYIMDNSVDLGGAAVMQMEADDFDGDCHNGDKMPISKALYNNLGIQINN